MNTSNPQYVNSRVLKLNVGFLLVQGNGYTRTTTFDIPQTLKIAEDILVEGLHGDLKLTRISEGILVQGLLTISTHETCVRCLSDTLLAFPIEIEELFATSYAVDSAFYIDEDNLLDLAPLLREEIFLNKPTQIYCQENCQGLCPVCGQNLNTDDCQCQANIIDPRWSALANLKAQQSDDNF